MTGDLHGRFSLLNPRVMIALAHAGFALVCLLRPNLNILFKAYEPFGNMPAWGIGTGALAVVLFLAPRASPLLMVGQLISAGVLLTIALLLTLGVGLLPTAVIVAGLSFTSMLLFGRTFGQWCKTQDWYWDLRARPPKWVTRSRWYQALMRWHERREARRG